MMNLRVFNHCHRCNAVRIENMMIDMMGPMREGV